MAIPRSAFAPSAAHMARFGYDPFDLQLLVEASIWFASVERSRGRLPLQGVMRERCRCSPYRQAAGSRQGSVGQL